MWEKLLKPNVALAPLVLRLALAFVFIMDGWVKVQALQAGSTWTEAETLSVGTQSAVAWGEFICGIALALGLFTRLAALGIAVIMVGAIALVTGNTQFINVNLGPQGRMMNLRTTSGFETNFLILAMCFSLLLLGGGAVSLDLLLWRSFTRKKDLAPATAGSAVLAEKTAPS